MSVSPNFQAMAQLVQQDDVQGLFKSREALNSAAKETDINGRSLLHLAVHAGAADAALWLLDNKFGDANAVDNQGETPLMRASWLGEKAIVKGLIEAGADLGKVSMTGGSALHHAYAGGEQARGVADILIAAGANTQAADKEGRLPTDWSAQAQVREAGAKVLSEMTEPQRKPLTLRKKI
jgi:ankyrin repeat protein